MPKFIISTWSSTFLKFNQIYKVLETTDHLLLITTAVTYWYYFPQASLWVLVLVYNFRRDNSNSLTTQYINSYGCSPLFVCWYLIKWLFTECLITHIMQIWPHHNIFHCHISMFISTLYGFDIGSLTQSLSFFLGGGDSVHCLKFLKQFKTQCFRS